MTPRRCGSPSGVRESGSATSINGSPQLRDEAGLPRELHAHCLRHSYVTHLVEFGYPERFVTEQVGHSYAATTAIYTHVSDDFKNRTLSAALQRVYGELGQEATSTTRRTSVLWNLRRLMAERGMFSTTDLVGPLRGAGSVPFPRAGLPLGHPNAAASQPRRPRCGVRLLRLPAERPTRDRARV